MDEDKIKQLHDQLTTAAAEFADSVRNGEMTDQQAQEEINQCRVLIELIEMAAALWSDQDAPVTEAQKLGRIKSLVEMWPDACRRAGQPVIPFPTRVLGLSMSDLLRPN